MEDILEEFVGYTLSSTVFDGEEDGLVLDSPDEERRVIVWFQGFDIQDLSEDLKE